MPVTSTSVTLADHRRWINKERYAVFGQCEVKVILCESEHFALS